MNNFINSLILTTLSGLSTILGYFVIYYKGNKNNIIAFSLSLSSSVMIILSLTDLIPTAYLSINNYNFIYKSLLITFFIIIGIIISKYISNFKYDNNLKRLGIISLITIILHNIPEGIITFMISGINIRFGIELAIGISLHNIPEGISIAIPIYYSSYNKIKTLFVVLLAGLSEVLGAFIGYIFLKDIINNYIIGLISSFLSGIMINISLTELLPEALKYNKKYVLLGLIIGTIIMITSHIYK